MIAGWIACNPAFEVREVQNCFLITGKPGSESCLGIYNVPIAELNPSPINPTALSSLKTKITHNSTGVKHWKDSFDLSFQK